tara:strand:- start:14787 stop:15266 length:480 start_codon:yes stop_codon:yes gene_type:complete
MEDMERRRLLPEQFFKYVTQPLSREDVNLWVKTQNISVSKVSLFGDYLTSLYNLINDTYLGLDVIKTDKEITGHFNWCWEKTVGNFKKENINFNTKGTHYDYFFHFFYESFYLKKNDEHLEKLKNFINILFILHTQKTKSELDMLYEIYILLNDSLTVK